MSSTSSWGSPPASRVNDFVRRAGGRKKAGLLVVVLGALLIGAVLFGLARSQRCAVWAPIDVIESTDPLQELPIRVATADGAVAPAQTHDAVLDLSSVSNLVIGVDLDYVPTAAKRYEAVIRAEDGAEKFRDPIAPHYFEEGRFMLRLFSSKFRAGDYLLEIESFDTTPEGRVVAASWFQVTR